MHFEKFVLFFLMKKMSSGFTRRGPDVVTEELAAVLSTKSSYEFKALFDVVHENLRARNAATGGEEMMRLKTYERLQFLVGQGAVKKTITADSKKYQGVSQAMRDLTAQLKALRAGMPEKIKAPKVAAATARRSS